MCKHIQSLQSAFLCFRFLLNSSFLFPGAESISVYEDILRSVRYRLAKGSARFERRFRLSCSEMNGRYTSNELTLEVQKTLFENVQISNCNLYIII